MLLNAKKCGANLFEEFSNSPMWWMNNNDSTAGSVDGGDNLKPSEYDPFAVYLATVAAYARDHWGLKFTSIEPFNEPEAYWWKYPCRQEGCHFDVSAQAPVIADLRAELDKRGLQSVGISASDDNTADDAVNTWNTMSGGAKAEIAKVNTHGYYGGTDPYRGPNMASLYAAVSAAGRKIWMSEYGEGDPSGLTMAQSIAFDINQLHPSGWVYWQALDGGGWGLIQSDPNRNWIGPPNLKFYVFAEYSRTIRPGMTMMGSSDGNSVVSYDAKHHALAVVTVNGAQPQWISYDLSKFHVTGIKIKRWVTLTDSNSPADLYSKRDSVQPTGKSFRAWFDADSVQAFLISGLCASP
jgi:galactan endo-1,6-beta-galactosidase